jgi:hypothetical protein
LPRVIWLGESPKADDAVYPLNYPDWCGVSLALVSGTGLLHWTERAIGEINKISGQIAGALGWSGGLLGSFYLVRQFRERIR